MVSRESDGLGVPMEITEFFQAPGGHSMIIRGDAGTGKTTVSLQMVEALSIMGSSMYLSTRVSDDALRKHFPWLDSCLLPLQRDRHVGTAECPQGRIEVVIGETVSELDAVYEAVEGNAPERSLIVVDSVDALAERLGMDCSRLISTMQTDLVEGLGANCIFVLEDSDTKLDYLGDSVVCMGSRDLDHRRVREMGILKLRGCRITQPIYLYTLVDGRFRCFDERFRVPSGLEAWSSVEDTNGNVSTGVPVLDTLLSGGFRRGSMTLIEIDRGVPRDVGAALEAAMMANFASRGRGVVCVPMAREPSSNIRSRVSNVIGDAFDSHVRMAERTDYHDLQTSDHVMQLEGEDAAMDMTWSKVSYHLEGSESPYLAMMGFDTLESIYGRDVMGGMMDLIASMLRNDGVFVAFTTSSTASAERLVDMADVHLRLSSIGGTTVLYGEDPFTEMNAVVLDRGKGWGAIGLTPLQ